MAYSFTTPAVGPILLKSTRRWEEMSDDNWWGTGKTVYKYINLDFDVSQLPANTKITVATMTATFTTEGWPGGSGGDGPRVEISGTTAIPSYFFSNPSQYVSGTTFTTPQISMQYKCGSISEHNSNGPTKDYHAYNYTFTLYVEYEYTYRDLPTPQNIKLKTNYITSSSSTTLSWNAVSNGDYANFVSEYQVYRDGQAYGQPTTDTSMSVSGTSAGTYYDFTVKAISNVSGYDSEPSSAARLYIYGNNYSATLKLYTNVNKTSANTIYMGASNRPDVIPDLDVKSADYDGYNPTSGVDKDYDATTGIYTATITFYSGRTTTATAYVKSIDAPSAITFKGELTNNTITAQDIKYSWNPVEVNNATIKYVIGTSEITEPTYTKKITEITRGKPFALTVKPRAYGSYGGYTDGSAATSTTVYRANAIEDGTITVGIKGTNSNPEVAQAYVFGETIIWWNYSPATYGGNLTSISYSRIQNDNTATRYDGGPETISSNNSSYGDNVGGLSKSTLKYTITFTDQYGQTYTAGPYTIQKLDAPTVEITGITGSTPVPPIQGATLHFVISPVGASTAADMRYKIEVGYGDEFYEVQPEKVWGNDVSCAVQFNVKTANAAGKLTTLYQALTRTDSAPLGKPILRYRLTAYDINESLAEGVAYTTLQTDFTTKPTLTGNLTITNLLNPSLDYASSQDSIKMSGVNVVHKNFFGDTTTDHLTNLLVRNGNTTLFNRALTEANYDLSYTAAFGENAITTDTTYTYVYTVRKQYSDAITEDFKSRSLNMRCWIKPNIILTNLDWTTAGATPSIIGRIYSSTSKWGGSGLVDNIASIEVSISVVGEDTPRRQYTFNSTSTPALSDNMIGGELYASFQIGMDEMADMQLIADITITSTTGKTYKLSTPQVLVKEQGIPFAIRRHGTGVNIPKGFNPATNEPSIQITGNMDTDNVATFTNGPNRDKTCVIIQNDKGGAADTGKARLSLNKNGTEWTLSIFFD